jgi:arylsulfatase A-like enzyme
LVGSADWCERHLRLGAALGLGLGLLPQLALLLLPGIGPASSTLTERAGAVLCSLAAWTVLALVLALVTRSWLRWSVGRAAALVLSVAVLTGLAALGMVSIAVRILSGSALTLQALQFVVGSGQQFLHAALSQYPRWLGLVSLSALLLGLGLARWLYPALRGRARRLSRRLLLAALGVGALLGVGLAKRDHSPFLRGMFRGAPLLALVSSVDGPAAAADRPAPGAGVASASPTEREDPLVSSGPPRSTDAAWQRVAAVVRQRSSRPNVLLVMIDSLGPAHLGRVVDGRPVTPELDQLARESRRMTRAWTTSTHSNYAQMAVLSALLPYRSTGLDQYERLDYPRFLFHDLLHALGYDTATISSQDETWQGMLRFQDTGTPTYFRHALDHPGPHIDIGTEKVVPDALTTDLVLSWLTEPRAGPWALYVNFQATHFPYALPEQADRPFGRAEPSPSSYSYFGYPAEDRPAVLRRYQNALSYVDQQIGRLRRYLDETGELDDTLWLVTADHGELFGEHELVTHGRTLYDAEARVPLLLRWPGHLEPGDDAAPVSHIDLMPTVAELLDVPPHPSYQGRSFVPRVLDTEPTRAIFFTIQGIRVADGLLCWPWKLVVDRGTGQSHLYQLARDPEERVDLLEEHPSIAVRLAEVLGAQLRAQLDYHGSDPVWRSSRFSPRLAACPTLPLHP